MQSCDVFLFNLKQALEQTVALYVILDTITLMWRHFNDTYTGTEPDPGLTLHLTMQEHKQTQWWLHMRTSLPEAGISGRDK